MARRKSIDRFEVKEVVLNLIDLRFSVDAVAYMMNKSAPNTYAHIKSAGRMANREVIRQYPTGVSEHAKACINKLFPDSPWMSHHLLASAQASTRSPAMPPASGAKRGSRKYAKRKKAV